MPVASDAYIEAVDARAQLLIVLKKYLPEFNVRCRRLAKAEVKNKWKDGVVRRVCHVWTEVPATSVHRLLSGGPLSYPVVDLAT